MVNFRLCGFTTFLKGKIDDICLNSGCYNKILLTKWVMQQTFISPLVLEARGSKIKVRADFFPVRSSSWLADGCLHTVSSSDRQSELWSLPLPIKVLSHYGGPFSRTHLNLITLRPASRKRVLWGTLFDP